jgi:hypothetical protein
VANLLLEPQILQFTIGRRRKDVWRTEKPAFQSSRFAIAILVPKRDQSYHGLLPASDNDLLAPASSLNQSRKIGLGLAAGGRIAGGDYSRQNLEVIVAWKMEGVHLTRVMSYLGQNTDGEIDHALLSAIATDSERSAIEILDRLHGVGVPVASAILTTILPEKYTIIDVNALEALGVDDKSKSQAVYYLAYLKKCRELAAQFNVSLRTMDHALWQWGYEN